VKCWIGFVGSSLFDDMLKEAVLVGVDFDHAAQRN
jgi:hypothetical protein